MRGDLALRYSPSTPAGYLIYAGLFKGWLKRVLKAIVSEAAKPEPEKRNLCQDVEGW